MEIFYQTPSLLFNTNFLVAALLSKGALTAILSSMEEPFESWMGTTLKWVSIAQMES